MARDAEQLPTWLAWPFARLAPLEEPGADEARAAADALVEHAAVLLLTRALADEEQLDLNIEAAIRLSMSADMAPSEWRDVLDALVSSDQACGDGVDATPLRWLLQEDAAGRPIRLESLWEIVEASSWLRQPLLLVVALRGAEVRVRRFVGTGRPAMEARDLPSEPVSPGRLYVWGEADRTPVPVPRWLVRTRADGLAARYYGGREMGSRRWRYISRVPSCEPELTDTAPEDAPVYLAEPTWHTEAGVGRRVQPEPPTVREVGRPGRSHAMSEDTQLGESIIAAVTALREAEATGEVFEWAQRAAVGSDRQLVLCVAAGREILRGMELSPGSSVVVGRKPAAPAAESFAIHHKRMSRTHARVWNTAYGEVFVQDLASVNGTFVNGEPAGHEPMRVTPGDRLLIGGTLLSVEWMSREDRIRIQTLVRIQEDRSRDPLTGLHKPTFLPYDLPDWLGGRGYPTRPQTGIFASVRSLSTLHEQRGAEVADVVFRSAARLCMFMAPEPELCVRAGYGEVLVVVPAAASAPLVGEVVERLRLRFRDQVWETSARLKVHVDVAAVQRGDDESPEAWINRLRHAAQRATA